VYALGKYELRILFVTYCREGLIGYVHILSTLNLSTVTSSFHTIAIFVIVGLQTVLPSALIYAVVRLTSVPEVAGSNLGRDVHYPGWAFSSFP
jgi:hypothetical protein